MRAEPARWTGVPDYHALTGLSKLKTGLWLFFHFAVLRAGYSLIQALEVRGKNESDLSMKGRRAIMLRMEEGHGVKRGFL